VPVLHHDGNVIWDSLSICEYVAELFPDANLWPTDRAQRAKARSISCEMHSSFAALRRDMWMDILESKPGVGHSAEALADVRRIEQIWHEQLAAPSHSGGPFLFGAFTIADAMFAPVVSRFRTYGVDIDARCRAYMDAVFALPGTQQWMREAESEPKNR
jgi:glutathione S-transferase